MSLQQSILQLTNMSHAELVDLRGALLREIGQREQEVPVRYKCCECGLESSNDDTVYAHLRRVHRYPCEDAATGLIRIYR
jgi:hypothetical protein